ncbi:MAG: prolyl aminopeptidase [Alphaproteobacteria bacterium]|nr:prolyl aminopeptidase [Alphaproteobacteria bacterium]
MSAPALFPEIEPYRTHMLPVGSGHTLYVEECGNPMGQPIVFVHGGPGGGISPRSRRMYDPAHYRIVLFDQRGAGKSTPFADLTDNTTWHLVADMEVIRTALGIERWIVFGGSWGSTLGLAYAETHPERVSGLILRGIFLARPMDVRWLYQEGSSFIYPDAWEEYLDPIPPEERHDMVAAYYRRLTANDPATRLRAAAAWSKWEGATSFLIPQEQSIEESTKPERALPLARIECHYFQNNSFFATDNWLIENVHRIRHIPGVIIHGRYDMVCPIRNAWDLHRAWPEAGLHIVPDAGHGGMEAGNMLRMLQATEDFKRVR